MGAVREPGVDSSDLGTWLLLGGVNKGSTGRNG